MPISISILCGTCGTALAEWRQPCPKCVPVGGVPAPSDPPADDDDDDSDLPDTDPYTPDTGDPGA